MWLSCASYISKFTKAKNQDDSQAIPPSNRLLIRFPRLLIELFLRSCPFFAPFCPSFPPPLEWPSTACCNIEGCPLRMALFRSICGVSPTSGTSRTESICASRVRRGFLGCAFAFGWELPWEEGGRGGKLNAGLRPDLAVSEEEDCERRPSVSDCIWRTSSSRPSSSAVAGGTVDARNFLEGGGWDV